MSGSHTGRRRRGRGQLSMLRPRVCSTGIRGQSSRSLVSYDTRDHFLVPTLVLMAPPAFSHLSSSSSSRRLAHLTSLQQLWCFISFYFHVLCYLTIYALSALCICRLCFSFSCCLFLSLCAAASWISPPGINARLKSHQTKLTPNKVQHYCSADV